MKQTGKCPKCGGIEIYTDSNLTKRGERCSIPVTSWTSLYVENYICLTCGYFEEYIEKPDEKKLEKIKSEWNKVNPQS